MTTVFPPHGNAADFLNACIKWSPAADGGTEKAIWRLHDALRPMVGSIAMVANGWTQVVNNTEMALQGALHPSMRAAMVEVFNPLNVAALKAAELENVFNKVYADAIARRATVGGQALNV